MTDSKRHSISLYCAWKKIFLIPLVFLLASCMDATPPIIKAVKSGSLEEVQKAIRYKADLNAVDERGLTALLIAMGAKQTHQDNSYRNYDIAIALIEAGADLNAEDQNGITVLDYAIWWSKTDLFKLLIEKGAQINKIGNSTLARAILCKNMEIFDFILEKTEYEYPKTAYGSAVNAAIASDKHTVEFLTKLLNRGANIHGYFRDAARYGNVEAMKFLLQHGADINETSIDGGSGLISASYKGHVEAVRFLLEKGADISMLLDQRNALYWAVDRQHPEIVDLLLEKEIDTSGALVLAVEKGDVKIIKKLLKYSVDLNETNLKGYTPLTIAVIQSDKKAVQILIEHGADVYHPDKNGMTALQYAQEFEDEEMIKLLKNAGAKE